MTSNVPDRMTAIEIIEPGGSDVLVPRTCAVPVPGPGEILIRVAAAGVNRPDVLQRQGVYPGPPGAPNILGLEIAGEVVALGPNAQRWSLGDQVLALVSGGGYAEYCSAHATHALPIPKGLAPLEAATIPEAFFTVWSNVFDRGGLVSGECMLVHGGSSGIGTTAIQLAKRFGARVVTTAGSDKKCRACSDLGADLVVNYNTADFVKAVNDFTNGNGADLVLDMVGGDYLERNFQAAATEGRIVQIAYLRGFRPETNLQLLMTKRLTHTGSTLRPRSVEFKAGIARSLEAKVWPLLETGTVRPVIDTVFKLADARLAHELMESSSHIGKIVLTTAN